MVRRSAKSVLRALDTFHTWKLPHVLFSQALILNAKHSFDKPDHVLSSYQVGEWPLYLTASINSIHGVSICTRRTMVLSDTTGSYMMSLWCFLWTCFLCSWCHSGLERVIERIPIEILENYLDNSTCLNSEIAGSSSYEHENNIL